MSIAELQYKNGQKLQCIYFDDGSLIDVHANPDRQMEITVVMESGMHCGIPHAIVTECDVSVQKWCLHNVQGVAFMPPETGERMTEAGKVIRCTCGDQHMHWVKHEYDCAMKLGCLLAEERAKVEALTLRINEAMEVYAGMEGFNPETAPEAYCLRIIEQMYKALLEQK